MHGEPSLKELIESVSRFISEIAAPQLKDRDAFHARVAVNALAIAAREIEAREAAETAEHERLCALLGTDGPLDALNRKLCDALRAGEMTLETPGLLAHLKATMVDQVAVDQPKYSGYRHAIGDDV